MEQGKHRQSKRQLLISSPQATGSLAWKSRNAEVKPTKTVERNFSKSPRKKTAVFKNPAVKLFPGETIFEKKVRKNPSVLTDPVKATVVDFYCSDMISVISLSRKEKHIIRDKHGCEVRDENEDTVKLQRPYMMYTLSQAFEMLSEQNPKTKISRSTFCNCMLDHVMLRANTPAKMCLCTYHGNMHLLVNAIEKLPSVTDLLNHIFCEAESQKCMFQSCESCGKLSLWKQYCTSNCTSNFTD